MLFMIADAPLALISFHEIFNSLKTSFLVRAEARAKPPISLILFLDKSKEISFELFAKAFEMNVAPLSLIAFPI
jgi:hypothetical protein